jgi:hypothetical protein
MTLIVEFYKDFDASILDGVVRYAYAFRVLTVKGPKDRLMEVVRIIDAVTVERSITLRGDKDEHGEPNARDDLLAARGARRAPHLLPGEKVEELIC